MNLPSFHPSHGQCIHSPSPPPLNSHSQNALKCSSIFSFFYTIRRFFVSLFSMPLATAAFLTTIRFLTITGSGVGAAAGAGAAVAAGDGVVGVPACAEDDSCEFDSYK